MRRPGWKSFVAAAVILWTWILAGSALAHCDTMDGPAAAGKHAH